MAASSSSFQKRTKTKLIEISGTRASLYNNQLLVSSGIPSLDAVLGGGVAVGTVLLIEEDASSMHAQLMLKYFAAEAIVTGQALTFVSADQDPHKIIKDLPAPVSADPTEKGDAWSDQHSAEGGTDEKMSIAWRYQNQPNHLRNDWDDAFVWRLEQLCDTVLRLQSFGASEKEKGHVFKDYSGLLHVIKLPCLNELVTHMPETLDLAFRLRRKKFTIEKLHLPPELSDTSGREQDDPVPLLHPVVSCGSTRPTALSTKLDF
ncbi:hypothetical protein C0Q70_04872 [Pomacea canaliculata]|uniref:Elongator complex protein 4 n=1 Tax=Pomacea canaliculata TaxID=400727 RepID=A0A2T7PJP0_POMCA|nr:hypothetical protein C0Q70_04872 [Pomacea canaliculata]